MTAVVPVEGLDEGRHGLDVALGPSLACRAHGEAQLIDLLDGEGSAFDNLARPLTAPRARSPAELRLPHAVLARRVHAA